MSNPVLLGLFVDRHGRGQVVPLKLLQAPLQACLDAIDPPLPRLSPSAPDLVADREDPRGSWLPSLQKWLPSTWVEAGSVADKAAKHGDAEIYTDFWDTRISSVLPCTAANLRLLRRVSFQYWCGWVGKSLRGYLARQYGRDWASRLVVARQQAAALRADSASPHQGGKSSFK